MRTRKLPASVVPPLAITAENVTLSITLGAVLSQETVAVKSAGEALDSTVTERDIVLLFLLVSVTTSPESAVTVMECSPAGRLAVKVIFVL